MEALEEFLEGLRRLSAEQLIIVEGKNDKMVLEAFTSARIEVLKGPVYLEAERFAAMCKEVVVLTDLDEEGKRLHGQLKGYLERLGVKVDDRLRTMLFQTDLRQLEGLASYARALDKNNI